MTDKELAAASRLLDSWGRRLAQHGGALTESQANEVLAHKLARVALREYKARHGARITETLPMAMSELELEAVDRHLLVWRKRLDQAALRDSATEAERAENALYNLTWNAYLEKHEHVQTSKEPTRRPKQGEFMPGKGVYFVD